MTNKLLIGTAVVIGLGFAALFGGVLDRPAATTPDALATSQSVEDFKAGFSLNASSASLVESWRSAGSARSPSPATASRSRSASARRRSRCPRRPPATTA